MRLQESLSNKNEVSLTIAGARGWGPSKKGKKPKDFLTPSPKKTVATHTHTHTHTHTQQAVNTFSGITFKQKRVCTMKNMFCMYTQTDVC